MGSERQDQLHHSWEGTHGYRSDTETPGRASKSLPSQDRRPVLGQSHHQKPGRQCSTVSRITNVKHQEARTVVSTPGSWGTSWDTTENRLQQLANAQAFSPDVITEVILIPGHTDISRSLSIKLKHIRHGIPFLVGMQPYHGRNPMALRLFPKNRNGTKIEPYHQGSHLLEIRLWIYVYSSRKISLHTKFCQQVQSSKAKKPILGLFGSGGVPGHRVRPFVCFFFLFIFFLLFLNAYYKY